LVGKYSANKTIAPYIGEKLKLKSLSNVNSTCQSMISDQDLSITQLHTCTEITNLHSLRREMLLAEDFINSILLFLTSLKNERPPHNENVMVDEKLDEKSSILSKLSMDLDNMPLFAEFDKD